ncbi:hypothetical protein A2673_03945 [Candidatus Kaiserbacteria bacterium RIFCSPHIGHO2_01_FULL_50_13]|uniref:Uncharacterized protein n=1 Tax=Candidatus Kaiserbacteria bacterium RIFCSPLOWO2_01_FULL_50_24 TaxID=1798507 RepID=A0A1F6EIP6_9BACT|nr:MAG: hypothetical protein A2673_03945 [Candidatus Kaiserbacteria bacterium RIFCSPHIGHO2_01_FULL_50_13]OGG73467.1 MAG: hypothetical protein A3A34_01230 [Candidatus Kaiserbacteria bacterium RIFCSPLOWO2_01_FULL_50_24]OGG80867.1 MAG: hypothetical protein A3H74_02510 [Candidatus Kaiserbacteria bacterium RIFCSPLOWO2_02_FULL_51_13]
MGEIINIEKKRCVALNFRRWQNERQYRELRGVFVGPFREITAAKSWYARLTNILETDGEITVTKVLMGPVPWKRLRERGRKLIRPYDDKKETLWTFVRSLEKAILKRPLMNAKWVSEHRKSLALPKPTRT